MEYNFCYVLDYCSCKLYCLNLYSAKKKPEDFETSDELLQYWGFNIDEISYMFSDVELKIDYICKPFKD